MVQDRIKAVFMRGGSSKGVFFHQRDLPDDRAACDQLFLSVLGSPDPYGRQLNGLGGGISSLSKAVIIAPSERTDADVDYTFAQVSVHEPLVDFGSTCGNLSSAVGPFAVDEGLVNSDDGDCLIRIYNTNTNIHIHARLAVDDNEAQVTGDYVIAGVSGSGARISLDFLDPGGSFTKGVLPTGNVVDTLHVNGIGDFRASLVDVSNPAVFLDASDFGLTGTEAPEALDNSQALHETLDAIRRVAAVEMGLADSPVLAGAASPRIALLSPPQAAKTLDGRTLSEKDMHISVRMVSMGNFHRAVPLTGAMCLGAACHIEGTIAHALSHPANEQFNDVLIAHPSGVLDVGADLDEGKGIWHVKRTRVYRTARRLMEGHVLVPRSELRPEGDTP